MEEGGRGGVGGGRGGSRGGGGEGAGGSGWEAWERGEWVGGWVGGKGEGVLDIMHGRSVCWGGERCTRGGGQEMQRFWDERGTAAQRQAKASWKRWKEKLVVNLFLVRHGSEEGRGGGGQGERSG